MEWDELPALFPSIESPETWLPMLQHHSALLLAAEPHTRVTSVAPEDVVRRHYAESLEMWAAILHAVASLPRSIVDVGSGGGFPGIVMACVAPGVRFALVEPLQKRARLLESIAAELELENVQVFAQRAEEAGRGPLRARSEVVVARAVAALPVLLEYTIPLTAVGGLVVLPKGSGLELELEQAHSAMARLGCRCIDTIPMRPEISETLTLALFRKDRGTPAAYPRRPGHPAKNPL